MAYKKGASLGLTSNNTVNNPKSGYSLTTGEFVGITPSEQDISNSLNSILPDLSPVRAVTSLKSVNVKNYINDTNQRRASYLDSLDPQTRKEKVLEEYETKAAKLRADYKKNPSSKVVVTDNSYIPGADSTGEAGFWLWQNGAEFTSQQLDALYEKVKKAANSNGNDWYSSNAKNILEAMDAVKKDRMFSSGYNGVPIPAATSFTDIASWESNKKNQELQLKAQDISDKIKKGDVFTDEETELIKDYGLDKFVSSEQEANIITSPSARISNVKYSSEAVAKWAKAGLLPEGATEQDKKIFNTNSIYNFYHNSKMALTKDEAIKAVEQAHHLSSEEKKQQIEQIKNAENLEDYTFSKNKKEGLILYNHAKHTDTFDRTQLYKSTGLSSFFSGMYKSGKAVWEAGNYTSVEPSKYEYASTYLRQYFENTDQHTEKLLQDFVTNISHNAIPLILQAVPVVGQALYMGTFALSTFGNSYDEAWQLSGIENMDKGSPQFFDTFQNVWEYATVSTAFECGLEKVSNMLGSRLTGGKDVTDIVTTKMKSTVLKFGTRLLFSAGGEFVEESAQAVISPILQNLYLGTKNETIFTDFTGQLSEAAYAGFIGFLSGVSIGGVGTMQKVAQENNAIKIGEYYNNIFADTGVDVKNIAAYFKEVSNTDTELYILAEKVMNGDTDVQTIGEMMQEAIKVHLDANALVYKAVGQSFVETNTLTEVVTEYEQLAAEGLIFPQKVVDLYNSVKAKIDNGEKVSYELAGEFAMSVQQYSPKALIMKELVGAVELSQRDMDYTPDENSLEPVTFTSTTKPKESTNAVTNSLESYSEERKNIIKSFLSSVDEKLKSFVQSIKNGDTTFKRQKISDVSERAATDIKSLLGIDVSGYTHDINTDSVRHILNRHGENGIQDNTMSVDEDIARVGWVIENYDTVELIKENGEQVKSSGFADKNNNPAPQIRYIKKIDGTYYVVEAAFENKYKKLWVQSVYLQKNKEDVTQAVAEGVKTNHDANARSALASPSSNNNIPQGENVVNNNISSGAENYAENPYEPENVKNIALTNPNKKRHHTTKAEQDYIVGIGKALGRTVVFEDIVKKLSAEGIDLNGQIPDGYIDSNNVIHINYTVIDPVSFILKHELTHFGEGTKQYDKFIKAVNGSKIFRKWLAEQTESKNNNVQTLIDIYKKINNKDSDAEVYADFVGDNLFTDNGTGLDNLINSIDVKDRAAFIQYILDFLSYLKKKLTGYKDIVFEISRLEDSFNRMLSEASQRKVVNEENNSNGIRFSFARVMDSSLINEAEQMEKEGKEKTEIWRKLGIIRDFGGEWVYEIDDSKIEFYPDGNIFVKDLPEYDEYLRLQNKKKWTERDALRYSTLDDKLLIDYDFGREYLKNYVKHDKLFEKYPQLKTVVLEFRDFPDSSIMGEYDKSKNTIVINRKLLNGDEKDLKRTLIHEIQHAIQDIDNREPGSSIKYWNMRLKRDKKLPINPLTNKEYSPEEAYFFTKGELESGITEDRLDYSEEERKEDTPFWFKEFTVSARETVEAKSEEYMTAVENGNTKTAQHIVDDVAKLNGYTERLFHQTEADFTEFNTENQRAGKYDWELPTGIFLKPTDDDIGLEGKKQMELYAKLQKPLKFKNRQEARNFWVQNIEGYVEAIELVEAVDKKYNLKYNQADEAVRQYMLKWRRDNPSAQRKEINSDVKFQHLLDRQQEILENWESDSNNVSVKAKKLIDNFIAQNDYDSIIVEKDQDGENRSTKSYIVFSSNQLKDASPITYDDNGEVISLSERFDSEKADIRYSMPGEGRMLYDMLDRGEITKEEYHNRMDELYDKAIAEVEDKALAQRITDARYANQLTKRIKRQNEQLAKTRAEISAEITAQREERASKQKNIEHIRKTVSRIDKLFRTNSNTKHIPEELKDAVSYFVRIFLDNDVSAFDKKELKLIRTAYGDLAEGEIEISGYDEEIKDNIKTLEKRLSGKTLRQLDYYDTLLIRNIVDNFAQIIKFENEMFVEGKNYEVDQIGNQALGELTAEKAKTENGISNIIDKSVKYSNMTPIYFFDRIGGVFKKLFNDIVHAQDKWYRSAENAKTYIRQMKEKYNYSKWENDTLKFTTEKGDKIEITREQAMLLYATARRENKNVVQNAEHLFKGGVVIPPSKMTLRAIFKKYQDSDAKGVSKITDAMTEEIDSRAHRILPQDIVKVMQWLTEEQIGYANAMVEYLSKDMAALGNEVSMQLYGITKFNEDYYIPYNSAQNYLYSQPGVTNEARLKHQSFTKETVHGANNPLVLSDFTEVCADHINRMCMYNALTIPLENMNKIFNYQRKGENIDTKDIKAEIERVHGTAAVDYIKQFLTDMNGNVRTSGTDKAINRWISRFKKGAVFASASVVVQQPSAIMRAMAYINPKYFTKTTLKLSERDYQQAVQYAPVAGIKEMGRFDTGVGAATTNWLLQETPKGLKNKVKKLLSFSDSTYRDDKLSYFAAKADEITWAHIWAAVKAEIADTTDLKAGSEEFFKACGERFTEVINYTQVYDSTISRSQIMRDKSTGAQMLTAFMSEPTVSLNLLMNAVHQAKTNGEAGKKFAKRAVGAFVGNVVLNALLKSLVTAGRDDDEDKTYLEKYIDNVTGNILSDINPLSMMPFVKDVISVFEGYTVERADMNLFSDLAQSFKILQNDNKTTIEKIESIAGSLAAFLGLPVKNVLRDMRTAYNIACDFKKDIIDDTADTDFAGIKYAIGDHSNKEIYEELAKAAEKDNEEEYQKIYKHLVDDGKSDSDIISGVRRFYKDSKEVKKETEKYVDELEGNKTYQRLDDEDKKKLKNNIASSLATEKTVNALSDKSQKYDELYAALRKSKKLYDKMRKEMIAEGYTAKQITDGVEIARIAYMKSIGIDVHEYLLYKIATNSKNADIDNSGGVSKVEKNAAIREMDIDSKAKQYFIKQHK